MVVRSYSLPTLVNEQRGTQIARLPIPLDYRRQQPAGGVGQNLDTDTTSQALFDHGPGPNQEVFWKALLGRAALAFCNPGVVGHQPQPNRHESRKGGLAILVFYGQSADHFQLLEALEGKWPR